jgi:hypothetical protein
MFVIEALLVEIACLCRNRQTAPASLLFTFATKTTANQHVEMVRLYFTGDGDRKLFRPPLTLLKSEKTGVLALSTMGHLIGAGQVANENLNSREAATAILAQISERELPEEPNASWDDGLAAIEEGVKSLINDSQVETVFSFSKVYAAPESYQPFSLSYAVTDEEGRVGSRYKVVVALAPVEP